MINLKELEKEIDALLESETPESLREWLNDNKANHIDCYVDAGGVGGSYQNLIIKEQLNEITVEAAKNNISDSSEFNFTSPLGFGIAA